MINEVLFIIAICFGVSNVNTDSVCTAKMLIQELRDDLKDNGKLDCLLDPIPPTGIETPDEEQIRYDAAWDTDCAFEASYDWFSIAKENYGIKTGLVDSEGKVIEEPLDNQADICELIRSMINAELFDGYNLKNLKEDAFDDIECPGPQEQQNYQICAASGGGAAQKYTWTILLEPSALTILKNQSEPSFSLDSKSKEILNQRTIQQQ